MSLRDFFRKCAGPAKLAPCPACLAPCSECNGTGETFCRFPGCGGQGFVILQMEACPSCMEAKKIQPECEACHGDGRVILQKQDCPCCHGTKLQPCTVCKGTGQESTGRDNSGRPPEPGLAQWQWHSTADKCQRCKGTSLITV